MFYLKKIIIHNIKLIEHLEIEFPLVQDKVLTGTRLTGNNYKGKTTILQCINYGLCNDIGDNLDKDCISNGQIQGWFKLELYKGNEVYTITNTFTSNNGITKRELDFQTPAGLYHTDKSIKDIFKYHYISANEIIRLSASAKGRRDLMKYFLYSVSTDIRDKYIEADDLEQRNYSERTELNVAQDTQKKIMEDSKLKPEEELLLSRKEEVKEKYNLITEKIRVADGIIEKIETLESDITNIKLDIKKNNDTIIEISKGIDLIDKDIEEEIKKDEEINNKFKDIKVTVQGAIYTSNNITKLRELLSNTIKDIDALLYRGTKDEDKLNLLHSTKTINIDKINNLDKEIIELNNKINYKTEELQKELSGKTKVEYTDIAQQLRNQLLLISPVKENITSIEIKYNKHLEDKERYDKAHELWKEKDKLVNLYRQTKKDIIISQKIEVDNFEFSPDGVELKGFNFSESHISGADRRICALQFTVAMNKQVGFAILEEMESLDDAEEKRVSKFAADKGFMILSDNVIKNKVEDISIEHFSII